MTGISPTLGVFPVTLWQKYVLDEAVHPKCTAEIRDRLVLVKAVLMRPRIDKRRLQRAVDKLRSRHDSLRIRFDQVNGVWRALIDPASQHTIKEIDLGDQDDDTFQADITAISNAPMALIGGPLAEFIIVKCGHRGDVLIIRIHHAITDGHGMVVLTEDLAKFLIGLDIPGRAVSHADYIARFQSPPQSRAIEVSRFWQELHKDIPDAPNIGRKAKGLEPLVDGFGEVDQRLLTFEATPQSLRQFEADTARSNSNTATTLYAAYLEAMCQCYDLEKMMFLASMARTDPALDTYIGDHTLDPFLPYRAGGDHGFAKAAKKLGETMFQTLANLPSDMARRGGAYEAALINDRKLYPRQFVVEHPGASMRQSRSIFSANFSTEVGAEQQIGPYRIVALDVSVRRRKWADMHFDVGGATVRTGFKIHYDGKSYTDQEIQNVGDKICDLLGLEQTRAVLS